MYTLEKRKKKKKSLSLCRRWTVCLGSIRQFDAAVTAVSLFAVSFFEGAASGEIRARRLMSQLRGGLYCAVPAARLNPKPRLFQNDKHPRPSPVSPTSPWFLVGALDQHASPAVTLSDLGSAACCFFSETWWLHTNCQSSCWNCQKKEKLHAFQRREREREKSVVFFALFKHQGCKDNFD